jgi:nicotinamidase-related amidase
MNITLLSELDQKIINITGYGAKRGYGSKPTLMIIDAQKKFVGIDTPLLDSIEIYPLSIGEKAYRAVERIKAILEIARNKEIPVFYSTSGVPLEEMPFNSFAKKRIQHEKSKTLPADTEDIVDPIHPLEREWLVHKRYASAFFGTPLMSFLNTVNCDTIIVTGFVTSGCIRAFVVDAASYNFNVIVPEDCVADRLQFAHDLNLIDMNLKYADVVVSKEVIEYLEGI